MESLYERLGGAEGIARLVNDLVDLHAANPRIAPRFADTDLDAAKKAASAFLAMGTGGPAEYQGKDMRATHQGMNIDAEEFLAVLDDALEAMTKNNIGQREQEEVLFAMYSMKGDILHV